MACCIGKPNLVEEDYQVSRKWVQGSHKGNTYGYFHDNLQANIFESLDTAMGMPPVAEATIHPQKNNVSTVVTVSYQLRRFLKFTPVFIWCRILNRMRRLAVALLVALAKPRSSIIWSLNFENDHFLPRTWTKKRSEASVQLYEIVWREKKRQMVPTSLQMQKCWVSKQEDKQASKQMGKDSSSSVYERVPRQGSILNG